jgi:hypothetical protein
MTLTGLGKQSTHPHSCFKPRPMLVSDHGEGIEITTHSRDPDATSDTPDVESRCDTFRETDTGADDGRDTLK